MIYIVGTREGYMNWLHENDLTPRDAVHVTSEEQAQGRRLSAGDQVIDVSYDSRSLRLARALEERRR